MDGRAPPNLTLPTFNWAYSEIKSPSCGHFLWNAASRFTILSVGLLSKIAIQVLNKTQLHNYDKFFTVYNSKPVGVPLITVSNHHSCFDDPGLWGILNLGILAKKQRMRWALAAHDICFTNRLHSYFFLLGKCIPVVRGNGVYQEAMDFLVERLKEGDWIHIFPEGKVNMTQEFIRFKWGIGRLINDSPITPLVIPMWHIGMEDILPNKPPYIIRTGKVLTVNFGDPINLTPIFQRLSVEEAPPEVAREVITNKIQEELLLLKKETEAIHNSMKESV